MGGVPGHQGGGIKIGFRVAKNIFKSIDIAVTTFFFFRVFTKLRGRHQDDLSPGCGRQDSLRSIVMIFLLACQGFL